MCPPAGSSAERVWALAGPANAGHSRRRSARNAGHVMYARGRAVIAAAAACPVAWGEQRPTMAHAS
eukprot:13458920-Alexandrium_andersonii.AAC.1